jgi:hypothetical protein
LKNQKKLNFHDNTNGYMVYTETLVLSIISSRNNNRRVIQHERNKAMQPPFDLHMLEMRKIGLLKELEPILDDQEIFVEVKKLVNADFSIRSIISEVLSLRTNDQVTTKELREQIAGIKPAALTIFDELVSVNQQIANKRNPFIKY